MMMNNYVDQMEPFSRRLKRNGGKLPVPQLPSAVAVVNDNLSTSSSLNGGSANPSRPTSGGYQNVDMMGCYDRPMPVKMDYISAFGQVAQPASSAQFEMEHASVNQTMMHTPPSSGEFGSLNGLRSAVVTVGSHAPPKLKRSPSLAGHFSASKLDNGASRTSTTSTSNKSGIAPFPKSKASQSGVRKHSKAEPISDIAKNFFRTNRRLKEFLTAHNALNLLPEGMVVVDSAHVSDDLKNSICEMNSPSATPPITDLVPAFNPVSDYAEDDELLRVATHTGTNQLTLDSDFVYQSSNAVATVETPSPVARPGLLELGEMELSAYGYQFAQAVENGAYSGRVYGGEGLGYGRHPASSRAARPTQDFLDQEMDFFNDPQDYDNFGGYTQTNNNINGLAQGINGMNIAGQAQGMNNNNGLIQGFVNYQGPAFGAGQLDNSDSVRHQDVQITTALNVKAAEFTPRQSNVQEAKVSPRDRRTGASAFGKTMFSAVLQPATLMRTMTDPDKSW